MCKKYKLLIIRLRSIGDVVLSTPCLQAIKDTAPDTHITYVVDHGCAMVVEGNPHIDELLVVRKDLFSQLKLFKHILATTYDVALNLHGGPRSVLLTVASLAGKRLGRKTGSPLCALYSSYIKSAREYGEIDRQYHMVERTLSACTQAGFKIDVTKTYKTGVYPSDNAQKITDKWIQTTVGTTPFVVAHLVKCTEKKQWNWEKARRVFEYLHEIYGFDTVLLGACPDSNAMDILGNGKKYVHNACSLNLQESAALMKKARLFFGVDSGPAHIASAQNIPVIVLFGSLASYLWRPWNPNGVVIEHPKDAMMRDISYEDVIAAIDTKID